MRTCALALAALLALLSPGHAAVLEDGPGRLVLATTIAAPQAPNSYEFAGQGVRVAYTTEGRRGQPTFSYRDGSRSLLFIGDQIRTEATELGTLVTVTLRMVVDVGSTTFSLLVPRVNLGPDNRAAVRTIGITTVHRLPFLIDPAPPQVDEYRVTRLAGAARFVVF